MNNIRRLPKKELAKGDDAVCVWCNRMIFTNRRYQEKTTGTVIRACNDTHAQQAFDKPALCSGLLRGVAL